MVLRYPFAYSVKFIFWLMLPVAFLFADSEKVTCGFCDEHRSQCKKYRGTTMLVFLFYLLSAPTMIGPVLAVAYGLRRPKLLDTKHLTRTHVWIENADPNFLAELPQVPEQGSILGHIK